MEPYRVDRDEGSVIPIDTLHAEIQAATMCVADITTRNPNVMYELGYAIASGKDVVIISGPNTEKYPFDIQHRGILPYAVGSLRDFEALKTALTKKLTALVQRQATTQKIVSTPIRSVDGLKDHETTALAFIFASCHSLDDFIGAHWIKSEMAKAGYSDVGARVAVAGLIKQGLVKSSWQGEYNEEKFVAYQATEEGENWLLENQAKLELRNNVRKVPDYGDTGITDDDIPF